MINDQLDNLYARIRAEERQAREDRLSEAYARAPRLGHDGVPQRPRGTAIVGFFPQQAGQQRHGNRGFRSAAIQSAHANGIAVWAKQP